MSFYQLFLLIVIFPLSLGILMAVFPWLADWFFGDDADK